MSDIDQTGQPPIPAPIVGGVEDTRRDDPTQQFVYLRHPQVDAVGGPVTLDSFRKVWEARGWEITDNPEEGASSPDVTSLELPADFVPESGDGVNETNGEPNGGPAATDSEPAGSDPKSTR